MAGIDKPAYVYRSYSSTLESHVDRCLEDLVKKLHEKGILSKEQRDAGLKSSVKRNTRAQTIKNIIKEKILEDEDNFETILKAFGSIRALENDIKHISQQLQKTSKGSTTKRKPTKSASRRSDPPESKDSSQCGDSSHSTSATPQREPGPLPSGQVASSEDTQLQSRLTSSHSGRHQLQTHVPTLGTIPGSPYNRRTSEEQASLELDSSSYPQPVEPEAEDAQLVPTQWTKPRQETRVTQTHYPGTRKRPNSMNEAELKSEKQCIDDLQSVVQETIKTAAAQSIENLTETITSNLSDVQERYKALAEHYQQEYESMKKEMEKLRKEHDLEIRRSSLQIQHLSELSKQQEQYHKEELEKGRREAGEVTASLVSELKEKEAVVKRLSEELERAKEEVETVKHRLRNKMLAEEQGVKSKMQIVSDIDKLIGQVQSPSEQGKPVDILHNIERNLLRLRDRPATTGGMRRAQ